MQNEERYKLFVALPKPAGTSDHIGPSPAYDSVTGELTGYRVGLYKGQSLSKFHRAPGEEKPVIFPLEDWAQQRDDALTYLQG